MFFVGKTRTLITNNDICLALAATQTAVMYFSGRKQATHMNQAYERLITLAIGPSAHLAGSLISAQYSRLTCRDRVPTR